MWADMLALIPEAIDHLPAGIASPTTGTTIPFGRSPGSNCATSRSTTWSHALRARGIEYWGCPMNGSFRHEPLPVFGERIANIRAWWRRCNTVGAGGMLVTSWEPDRLALELTTVVDAAAASLWLEPGIDDAGGMLARGFECVFPGSSGRELSRSALACDERAYVGYARWEINERWDTSATRRGLSRFESERAFYARLSGRETGLPRPLRASLGFRRYLAERDVYVRTAAASVLTLRRRLSRAGPGDSAVRRGIAHLLIGAEAFVSSVALGARAARELWRLSRDPQVRGPNERMIDRDADRLRDLRAWIQVCAADPRHLATASPVCGVWQLRFDVLLSEDPLSRRRWWWRRRAPTVPGRPSMAAT